MEAALGEAGRSNLSPIALSLTDEGGPFGRLVMMGLLLILVAAQSRHLKFAAFGPSLQAWPIVSSAAAGDPIAAGSLRDSHVARYRPA